MTVIMGYAHDDGTILTCDSAVHAGTERIGLMASKYAKRDDINVGVVACGNLAEVTAMFYALNTLDAAQVAELSAMSTEVLAPSIVYLLLEQCNQETPQTSGFLAVRGRLFVFDAHGACFESRKFTVNADGTGAEAARGAVAMEEHLVANELAQYMTTDVGTLLRAMQAAEDAGASVHGPYQHFYHPVPE